MTVEEIDIIVNVVVEKAIKGFQKLVPEIKRSMKSVTEQINKPDLKGFAGKIQQAINQGKQKLENFKKSNENNKIAINITTKEAEREISQLQKQINSLEEKINARQMKLNIINPQIDKIVDDTRKEVTPDGISTNNKSMDTNVNNALSSNKDFTSLNSQAQKLYTEIEMYNKQLDTAKSKMSQLGQNTSQTATTQNKLSSFFSDFKNKIDQVKTCLGSVKNTFNKMPNIAQNMTTITAKVQNNIKGMGKGLKQGLGNVFKYASALFSLRGIYSMLSSSAQSWLSSQNTQAKQLSANIEYMKYAMGSAFAPVIQYVTNLIYKLMKAIQTVIYSLFKVNIFANASANSYTNMAKSAKKTAKETKTLANIDEINNIGGNDNDSSDGNGTTAPSFDLSNIDTSLKDWFENLDFYKLGEQVAEKINTALSNIDWTKIQNGAKTIATNIGNFINGFVNKLDWSLVGTTIGQGINTAFTFANTLIKTIDFGKIGKSIATMLNSTISTTDWGLIGETIGNGISSAISLINNFLETVDFKQIGSSIATLLCTAIKTTDWSGLGKTISNSIGGIFDTITGFLSELDWESIIDAIIGFITGIDWGRIVSSILETLGSACASLIKLGMVIGEKIGQAIDSAKQYFQVKIEECGGNIVLGILKGIVDGLKSIGQWIMDNIFNPFIEGFKNAFGIHSPSTKMTEMGKYIIEGFKNGLIGIWENVKSIFINLYNSIKEIFNNIKEKIYTITNNIKNGVKDKFNGMKEKIYTITNNIRNGVKDKFNSMKEKVYTVVNNLRNGVKDKFNSMKEKIGTIVKKIKDAVGSKFKSVKDKSVSIFNSMKSKISNIFNGIWNVVKKIINSILGGIEKMANGIVKGMNKMINALNKLKFNVPDWVPGLGGKSFGFNIGTIGEISIPRLATGNVATSETLAIFGEYSNARTNPEITAPQSTIYETMVQALNDSNFNKGNKNSEFKTLIFKFGSYRVAFELEELRRKAQRQNGTATVTI